MTRPDTAPASLDARARPRALATLARFGLVGEAAERTLTELVDAGTFGTFTTGEPAVREAWTLVDVETGLACRMLAEGRRYVEPPGIAAERVAMVATAAEVARENLPTEDPAP